MDLHEFTSGILHDAEREAARIEAEAQERAAIIRSQTEAMVRRRREELAAQAQRAQQEELDRQEAARRRDAALAALACRHELLEEAFRQAAQELTGKRRSALLGRLLAKARAQAKVAGVAAVSADAAYLRRKVKVSGTQEGLGGFIAHTADRKVFIDMRFETLMDSVRSRRSAEIAAVLFGGER